jgi:putative molybdopterin biosynthesis protein
MSERNIYLKTIPVDEAVQMAMEALNREELIKPEIIPTHRSTGRVTSEAVYAKYSSPTYHSAAMDGIAVCSRKTFSAREDNPLHLELDRDYKPVNTGNALPEGMDAVIMIENVVQVDEHTVSIESPAFPWQHVRRIGEDIVATEMLMPQNHTITPFDVGALISAGIYDLNVWGKVQMTFIPTGDEVLPFREKPNPGSGEVIESNSQVFSGLSRNLSIDFQNVRPVPDNEEALSNAIDLALKNSHIVVVGAGSSAGSKDFTRKVFEKKGRLLNHGIAIMPGKPTILAEAEGKLLVGAPGYPVSAVVCFEDIITPIASWLSGRPIPEKKRIQVKLARRTPSKPGLMEIIRLAVGEVDGEYVGVPLPRGAGMITTLTKAQGIARIPENSEGVEEGETINVELLSSENALSKVIMHVGSHDNTLDLIGNTLMGLSYPLHLVSTHAGSMGGLTAIKNNYAMFGGCHLFDPESGDFNFPFLEKYLPDIKTVVINLAIRHQGLIVAKGNPKNISGIEDLTTDGINYINRQRGAGTRILFDHHLKKSGISPRDIAGYDREEHTHMAVAANVLTGAADCGLGIKAAANALDLDFVPLARERYDLIIPEKHLDDIRIKTLLDLISSDEIKNAINNLGGYETTLTGQEMKPGMGLG